MSHNTLGRIINISPVSSISLALLFFYFIIYINYLFFNEKVIFWDVFLHLFFLYCDVLCYRFIAIGNCDEYCCLSL